MIIDEGMLVERVALICLGKCAREIGLTFGVWSVRAPNQLNYT